MKARIDAELQPRCCPRSQRRAQHLPEIRAGTGGDEAALFAGDRCRMVFPPRRTRQGWRVEDHLGERIRSWRRLEIIVRISGQRRPASSAVRVRRPPGAARAGHRNPGPHPHLGVHRGGDARGRRGRRRRAQPRPICASTPSAPPPAASTSTRPIGGAHHPPPRPASSPNADGRPAPNKARRCACWRRRIKRHPGARAAGQEAATRKSLVAAATARAHPHLANFPRAGSPTTASTSPLQARQR